MRDLLGHEDVVTFATGAIRSSDSEKARWDLLQFRALNEVARVHTFGAAKYGSDNWRLGVPYRRLVGSLLRHLYAWLLDERCDAESGLHHLAHAAWNLLALLEFDLEGRADLDDRWRYAARPETER